MKAIVIGSGIAGIASALRLRHKGYEVDVYESAPQPGGKLAELKQGDFRFDMGPSLFTLPHLVDELFDLFPEEKKTFAYQQLTTICNYFWQDGHSISATSNVEEFAQNAEKTFGIKREKVTQYLTDCKDTYEKVAPTFIEKSLHKAGTWLTPEIIRPLLSMPSYGMFSSLSEVNVEKLGEPHMVQLFNRFATYNGSSPFLTPGIMQVIPHLEFNLGAFFPKKGMRSIASDLVELAKKVGVQFHCNQKVKKIIVCQGLARGIELDKEVVKSDLVVSNSDVFFTYKNLLPEKTKTPVAISQERSSSAFIFYWGINRSFPQLDVHNIFFTKDYLKEFKELFSKNLMPEDPTIYVHISSKVNAEDAPEGKENWFVMVNAPRNMGQDWESKKAELKTTILTRLSQTLGVNIEPLIETEDVLTPSDIESRTGSHQGSLYGTSSNSQLAAFLRHPNFSSKIKNLYHCGGSTHPGGGIPLCLNSAKIVASLISDAH